MQIIVDTREQRPWDFSSDVEVIRATLATGDYALSQEDRTVIIERKSLSDFVMCCGRARTRFVNEMRRMAEYKHRFVIVEASVSDIYARNYRGNMHPNSIIGATLWLLTSMGVHVIFAGTPQSAGAFAEHTLRRFKNELERAASDPAK